MSGGPDLPAVAPEDEAILEALAAAPKPVRSIEAAEGRPALLRRLRALEARGLLDLDWTLLAAGAGPRWVRYVRLAAGIRGGGECRRGLGPRQRALLDDLATATADGLPAPELAARHGSSTVATLARRGLVEIDTREAPRRPLEARPVGRRGGRPGGQRAERRAGGGRRDGGARGRRGWLDGDPARRRDRRRQDRDLHGAACADAGPRAPGARARARRSRSRSRWSTGCARTSTRASRSSTRGSRDGERADEWRRIRRGDVDVVVGTRLAILAPLADVGLIVVDEEHDAAYKSDRTPRLQARDAAIALGELAGAPVVLGSATPSVETEGKARDGSIARQRLAARLSGAPPQVEVVDLRAELAAGVLGMLSRSLAAALADLAEGDQAILVINRRGSASVVLCRDCGYVATCPDCTRPLVYHQAGQTLRCHHCGRAWPMPTRCPAVRLGADPLPRRWHGAPRARGQGALPGPAGRAAWIATSSSARAPPSASIDDFADGRLDVLVGTSLVTKGLDIPAVTLVGVVSADVALNLPDERAAERTYQLLAQAVGRAGRGERPGHAIIQTYQPEHPAIVAVATGRADAFYDAELDLRRRFGSPPFGRLVKLTVALPDRADAEKAGREMAERLRERAQPRPAPASRSADRRRRSSPGVATAGGSTSSSAATIPSASWATHPARRGPSTSTRRRSSEHDEARRRAEYPDRGYDHPGASAPIFPAQRRHEEFPT